MVKKKVLFIDDELDYCQIMKAYFQRKEYEVEIAYSLKEGIGLLKEFQPDILFLDNNLPDGQGWDHVDTIIESYPRLSIYLCSAYRHGSDFENRGSNITVWEKPLSMGMLNEVF